MGYTVGSIVGSNAGSFLNYLMVTNVDSNAVIYTETGIYSAVYNRVIYWSLYCGINTAAISAELAIYSEVYY